mmetsp:Transcript_9138/g.9921  ORF Transcript_9138/g.9921 Transcript_9138/m.9921 type:complete len:471 (-) Transcript_9138:580-1992(-)
MNGNSHLGRTIPCPVCRKVFPADTTNRNFNGHIDQCIVEIHSSSSVTSQAAAPDNVSNLSEINVMVRSNQEGSIATSSVDETTPTFHSRKNTFRTTLAAMEVPWIESHTTLIVDRQYTFRDSFNQLCELSEEDLHKELKIHYIGEIAQDAGGLSREWFTTLFNELFNADFCMFKRVEADDFAYTINELSFLNEEAMDYFNFCGILLGKSMFDKTPANVHLSKTLLNHILGKPMTLEDLQFEDKPLYQSLKAIRDTKVSENTLFSETFSVMQLTLEGSVEVDLKPGGREIFVNDENKEEYIDLLVQWELEKKFQTQLEAFLAGFYRVVPKHCVSHFETEEFELLLCGVKEIDVTDWKTNTIYKGEYSGQSKCIQWFWEVLGEMTQDQRSKFLQFCTGSTRIPVEGFKLLSTNRGENVLFCVQSTTYDDAKPFIAAHTCFNRIDLPKYPSKEELARQMGLVVENDVTGFGLE